MFFNVLSRPLYRLLVSRNRVSCNPWWPWTLEDNLKLLILWPPSPQCWDYRHAPSRLDFITLGIKPSACKHSANGIIAPASIVVFNLLQSGEVKWKAILPYLLVKMLQNIFHPGFAVYCGRFLYSSLAYNLLCAFYPVALFTCLFIPHQRVEFSKLVSQRTALV